MIAKKTLVIEKRSMEERYNCEAKIKWSYFNKSSFYDAKIFNFSRNGIYLETPHEIKPGRTIFIRVETLLSKNMKLDDHECLRTITLGDVKWCNELSADGVSYFGVGVRHCEVRWQPARLSADKNTYLSAPDLFYQSCIYLQRLLKNLKITFLALLNVWFFISKIEGNAKKVLSR